MVWRIKIHCLTLYFVIHEVANYNFVMHVFNSKLFDLYYRH